MRGLQANERFIVYVGVPFLLIDRSLGVSHEPTMAASPLFRGI